jgi:hypothetical protein
VHRRQHIVSHLRATLFNGAAQVGQRLLQRLLAGGVA